MWDQPALLRWTCYAPPITYPEVKHAGTSLRWSAQDYPATQAQRLISKTSVLEVLQQGLGALTAFTDEIVDPQEQRDLFSRAKQCFAWLRSKEAEKWYKELVPFVRGWFCQFLEHFRSECYRVCCADGSFIGLNYAVGLVLLQCRHSGLSLGANTSLQMSLTPMHIDTFMHQKAEVSKGMHE